MPYYRGPLHRSSSSAGRRRGTPSSSSTQATSPSSSAPSPSSSSNKNPLLMAAVEALFSFPPFFQAASANARKMIIKRAEAIGLDWEGAMRTFSAQDWTSAVQDVTDPSVSYPSYYTKPFHAYKEGNLCMEAALEVTMAAKSVHAMVMDPMGKKMDPEGDHMLRSNYSKRLLECLEELGKDPRSVKDILDIGAATGLSSLELLRTFGGSASGVHITALDLSPQFLAVGRFLQREREAASTTYKEPISFRHGAGEASGLPSNSQDLVSMCLVCHELPQAATREIFKEAYRVLRPGGALCIMEMDPTTEPFQRILGNPFAYTAFKSTEPWLLEYMALDLPGVMREQGFEEPRQKQATPRHKTVVCLKPLNQQL